jgi:hypothetical protein
MLLATLAWSLLEKNKLVAAAFGQIPISSLEEVANTVSKLRANGGDPLLIAHIAQAVTALAQQELAVAHPELVPQPAVVAAPPPPAANHAPEPAAVAAPQEPPLEAVVPAAPSPAPESAPLTPAPQSAPIIPAPQSAPVLADGSLPS